MFLKPPAPVPQRGICGKDTPMGTTTHKRRDQSAYDAANELRIAIYRRRMHSEDCALWDFESNNCAECDEHDAKVKVLRARWQAAVIRQGGAS